MSGIPLVVTGMKGENKRTSTYIQYNLSLARMFFLSTKTPIIAGYEKKILGSETT
jgi:hypothetical protein